jgi:hypothetical protein
MALTFTTGMTEIDDADALTDWSVYKITAGGGSPSLDLNTNVKKEGTGCIGIIPTRNKDCGMVFDYYNDQGSTVLDLTTVGNEVIQVWIQSLSSALVQSLANGGIYIIVTAVDAVPTTSNKWAKWYVGGSDEHPEGWTSFMIDTRKTPSATNGGWTYATDAPNTYRIGIGAMAADVTAWKAENLYVDRLAYGRPNYTLQGDGALTADWADFLSHADTEVNSLIEDINGAYALSCGIQFGDDAQTATTTFVDATGQTLNFKRYTYYSSGTVDSLTYTDYYKVSAEGAASFGTSVTIGSLVGSDSGIQGGTIRSLDPANVPVDLDFNTDQSHITALNMYGVTFLSIRGDIDLGDNSAFNYFSCTFLDCSVVDANGACEIVNCLFLDTGDPVAALLWNANIDISSSSFRANADPTYDPAGILHTVSGTYQYDNLKFSGNDYDIAFSGSSPSDWLTVESINQSDPGTYTVIVGSGVSIDNAVFLTVNVEDNIGTAISGVAVAIYTASGGVVELMNEYTTPAGQAQESYNYLGIMPITIRLRKSSTGDTRYYPITAVGEIGSTGFTLTAVMSEDIIAA